MIRDRIQELRRVPASQLRPHPRNWRTHPDSQRRALSGMLEEIGLADAVIARQLPDGSLQLIDGHLRAETAPDALLPVLVVDLDDAETEKLLLAHDALTQLAGIDEPNLAELIHRVETTNAELKQMFDRLADESLAGETATKEPDEVDIPQLWQVVAECPNETAQHELYEQLTGQGYDCRLLML